MNMDGECSVKELAETYYGKLFKGCKNIIQNNEYGWDTPVTSNEK